MTATEGLIAELRELHRIAMGGGIWRHNDVAMIYTAIPTILDALEAAEQRAETLRVALEQIVELSADRERFVLLGPRGFAMAERIAKAALEAEGKANGGG